MAPSATLPLTDPDLCEIRVVTYRRPKWLKRALLSLVQQTHPVWRALVYDDSPDMEGKAIVQEINDSRILYEPNPKNIGAAANIDKAFTPSALLGGGYACILEDDNWFLPSFLEENLRILREQQLPILLRNQTIWRQLGEQFIPTERTTRGQLFKGGVHTPLQLRARLFFNEGISNGGLFWSTSSRSLLQVGSGITITGVQEYCRTLGVVESVWFAPEPLAVWSDLEAVNIVRGHHANRAFSRAIQQIRIELVKRYGNVVLEEARSVAEEFGLFGEFTRAREDLIPLFPGLVREFRSLAALKVLLRYYLCRNPLAGYFSTRPL